MGNDKGNIASLQVLDNEIIRTKNNTKRSVLVFTQLGVVFLKLVPIFKRTFFKEKVMASEKLRLTR